MADPLHDILKSLEKHGIKKLYYSNKALVAQSPKTGEVIKFVHNDRAYIAFLKIIQKNKNSHFPRIIAFKKLTKGRFKDVYIIKMERLLPLTAEEYSTSVAPIHKILTYSYSGPNDQFKKSDEAKIAAIKDKDFVKIVQYLYKHKPSFVTWDLHPANVMKRQDGTFVIIDPYFIY